MERIKMIEVAAVVLPAAIYWFYTIFLMLTDASQHKGVQISTGCKIGTVLVVLVPVALLCALGVLSLSTEFLQAELGILFPVADYLLTVLFVCTPIAAFYALILLIREYNAWTRATAPPKYKINSTEDGILAMNAATGFMRDRKFYEEQVQLYSEELDARRRLEDEAIAYRLAADEAEGIFT